MATTQQDLATAMNGSSRGVVPRTPIGRLDLTVKGRTGLPVYGGRVYDEYLQELIGEKGRRIFREMSEQDPLVGGILLAIETLARRVQWVVTPSDPDSDEAVGVANFVDECLSDLKPSWPDTISEILSMLPYGWSWLEILYKRRSGLTGNPLSHSQFSDGKIGWRGWAIRSQESLHEWVYDSYGEVVGMQQMPPPTYELLTVPRAKSLHFVTRSRRQNPEGVSILRTAYRAWYMKKNIEVIEGIGIERDLAGLPVIGAPPHLLSEEASEDDKALLEQLKTIVTNIRRDEQEGVIMPMAYDEDGRLQFELKLLSTGGQRQFDTDKVVQRYDQRIAMSMMADFFLLGHEAVGSFALSDNKTDLFAYALGSVLDLMAIEITSNAFPALLRVNGIDMSLCPTLNHGDIETADLGKLGAFLKVLTESGMVLFPDEDLETFLLNQAGLPSGGRQTELIESPQTRREEERERRLEAEQAAIHPFAPQQEQGQQPNAPQTQAAAEPSGEGVHVPRPLGVDDEEDEDEDDLKLQYRDWAGNNMKGKKGFQPSGIPEDMDERLGRCYELTGQAIMSAPNDARLVHGTIQGFGKPELDHAWVELPSSRAVWEPATNQTWPDIAFKGFFNPVTQHSYSKSEAMERMLETKHYGPWESDSFGEPMTYADVSTVKFWANNNVRGRKGFQVSASKLTPKPTSEGAAGSVSGGEIDTMSIYADAAGKWDQSRVTEVHEPILADLDIDGTETPAVQTLYLTGGGYGSGKSTARASGLLDIPNKGKAVQVDPDAMKAGIPEYRKLAGKSTKAATFVHEESSHVSKVAVARGLKAGKSVVYDSSADSGGAKLHSKVTAWRALAPGVRVKADYVFPGSIREGQRRADSRAAHSSGLRRYVPPTILAQNHHNVASTFFEAAKLKTFDEQNLWSSAGDIGTPPVKIATVVNGKITVYQPGPFKAFAKLAGITL